MQCKKDLVVGFNAGPDDTYFHYTTVSIHTVPHFSKTQIVISSYLSPQTGWMMWPFMLAALSCGARIVTYDGTPFYPDVQTFLQFVSEQG